MTYLDAAYHILQQAGQPLRYEEITERALAMQLITPQGQTPEATMASRLYTDTLQQGTRFVRAGKGSFGLVDWQPAGIESQAEEINQTTREKLLGLLLEMHPERFQDLIGELLRRIGFDEGSVIVNKYSGDGGLDVVGVFRPSGLTGVNMAVQVKRWKKNVQAPAVTSLRGALQVHQQGIIITTSDFSKGAHKEAEAPNKTRIGLINGQELVKLLTDNRIGVVVETVKIMSLDQEWWNEFASLAVPPRNHLATKDASSQGEAVSAVEDMTTRTKSPQQKPTGFTFLGQSYPVSSWRDLLVTLCQIMAERHPDDFVDRALTVRGPRRQHIATVPDGMISPVPIGVASLWLEANQSATSAQRVAELILQAFGYPGDDFKVVFYE